MRCLPIALLLLPAAMTAAGLTIDHVTICGSDIRKLQSDLAAAGVQSVYGGAHTNGATEMALVSFPDGAYLEMMGIQAHADPHAVDEHVWAKFLRGNTGPCAWAIREPDMTREVARLQSTGIAVSAPLKSGRQRPDGVRLEWQTSEIGSDVRGTFFPFLIQDLTPREQRAYPQGKPVTTEFKGISRVVLAVRDLDAAVNRYRRAYALPEPQRQEDREFGARIAWFAATPVVLAQPLGDGSWLAARLAAFGEGPCAVVLAGGRKFSAGPRGTWFGVPISWSGPKAPGWRLGSE